MILYWDIYEIRCNSKELHGVKLRGRIRKFSIEKGITCFLENASDKENVVRFALQTDSEVKPLETFIKTLVPAAHVNEVLKNIPNPVLSKLKVNDPDRYEI